MAGRRSVLSYELRFRMPACHYCFFCMKLCRMAAIQSVSLYGNSLNLDVRSLRQRSYGKSGAGWEWSIEELCIHLVYCREVADVGEEHGDLHYILHAETCLRKYVLYVCEALACLCLNAALGKFACGRDDWQLAAYIHCAIGFNSLAVGPDSCRRIVCAY